ncbi:MAG: aminotransferase class V-fold PLP-dependent enzyme [Oscillospiraceae bacterium]
MKIYMNNAATSFPKPACVSDAVRDANLALPGTANRAGIEDCNVFDDCRKQLSSLLHTSVSDRIVLLPNATAGLNFALFGFGWRDGDVAVTSLAEHNSVLRPLYELERRGVIKTVFVRTDSGGRIDVDEWRRAIADNHPRMCVFTHASNVTGAVNDAELLCSAAKQYGATTLLDASQTLGIEPVRPNTFGADMVAFTGHKYLLGPQGSGGLYVGEDVQLRPTLFGGTGIWSNLETMPDNYPQHLEAGTGNETSFAGLSAALRWNSENSALPGEISSRTSRLREGLRDCGADVIDPGGSCTPVVSFIINGWSCEDAGFVLGSRYDIICPTGMHIAPKIFECLQYSNKGTVRLSLSRFTTNEEIDVAIGAVRDLLS